MMRRERLVKECSIMGDADDITFFYFLATTFISAFSTSCVIISNFLFLILQDDCRTLSTTDTGMFTSF